MAGVVAENFPGTRVAIKPHVLQCFCYDDCKRTLDFFEQLARSLRLQDGVDEAYQMKRDLAKAWGQRNELPAKQAAAELLRCVAILDGVDVCAVHRVVQRGGDTAAEEAAGSAAQASAAQPQEAIRPAAATAAAAAALLETLCRNRGFLQFLAENRGTNVESKLNDSIDDVVSASPVHMFCGACASEHETIDWLRRMSGPSLRRLWLLFGWFCCCCRRSAQGASSLPDFSPLRRTTPRP